jgi:hypothetical protein
VSRGRWDVLGGVFGGGLGVYRGKGEEAVVSRGVENKILEIWKAVGVERVRKAEK